MVGTSVCGSRYAGWASRDVACIAAVDDRFRLHLQAQKLGGGVDLGKLRKAHAQQAELIHGGLWMATKPTNDF